MPDQTTENVHTLVVEHTNQGTEETQGELAYVFTAHYIVRHPKECSPEDGFCPITEYINAVGIEDTLGLGHGPKHLTDGLYELEFWSRHYSGPDGDDWDAGVNVHPHPIPAPTEHEAPQ